MKDGKTFLGIIPARGSSKRLPNKNILPLAGKPLIYWTIEAAKNSLYLDKFVVSSEDLHILKIAEEFSASTIKRPDELSTDEALTIDVVKHVIYSLEEVYDFIVLLQPTSPLRTSKHMDEAIEFLMSKKADAVISVCPVDHPPQWSNILPSDLSLKNFLSREVINRRSQEFPQYYRINGAIYICKTEKFLEENTFFITENIYAFVMRKEDSVDIDDWLDFKLAEIILSQRCI